MLTMFLLLNSLFILNIIKASLSSSFCPTGYSCLLRVSRGHAENEEKQKSPFYRISIIASPPNSIIPPGERNESTFQQQQQIKCLSYPNHNFSVSIEEDIYQDNFKQYWIQNGIKSKIIKIQEGEKKKKIVFEGKEFTLSLPSSSTITRGFMFGDPCFQKTSDSHTYISCDIGDLIQTKEKIGKILQVVGSDIDFWTILGDNFYDQCGDRTREFFEYVNQFEIITRPLITTPGNHDFWTCGVPPKILDKSRCWGTDQLGYGFLQFYAQDTAAGFNTNQPFNLNPPPSQPSKTNPNQLADGKNFFFYHKIGAMGTISYSGGHEYLDLDLNKACDYFVNGNGKNVTFVFLLSHWSSPNDGCSTGWETPAVYERMASSSSSSLQACYHLIQEQKLFYFFGHTHSNGFYIPSQIKDGSHNYGNGFLLGGAGMKPTYLSPSLQKPTSVFGFLLFEIIPKEKRLLIWNLGFDENVPLNQMDSTVKTNLNKLIDCKQQTGNVFDCLAQMNFATIYSNFSLTDDVVSTNSPTQSTTTDNTLAIALGVTFGILGLLLIIIIIVLCLNKNANKKRFYSKEQEERESLLENAEKKKEF